MSGKRASNVDKRKSEFSYGNIFERSSSLNDIGNPTVNAKSKSSGESGLSPAEEKLDTDRIMIEKCVEMLDNSKDHSSPILTWLCSHKQTIFALVVYVVVCLIVWEHYFLDKYRFNIER